jgi:dienelactone hydrolase
MAEPWATMIRGNATDLSGKGFLAVVPRYFQRTGTADAEALGALTAKPTVRDDWQAALADAVVWARKLSGVNAGRVGFMGFSLGGHLCLRSRAIVKVLVEYFAPEFAAYGGIGTESGPKLHAQIHHGDKDKVVDFKDAKNIESQLTAEGAAVEFWPYSNAGHGFIGSLLGGSDADNAKASALANQRSLDFFVKYL